MRVWVASVGVATVALVVLGAIAEHVGAEPTRAQAEDSLAAAEAKHGKDSEAIVPALLEVASARAAEGDTAGAEAAARRAVAVSAARGGTAHESALVALGRVLLLRGAMAMAADVLQDAIEEIAARAGPAALEVAAPMDLLAEAQLEQGDAASARKTLDAALAIVRAHDEADPALLAMLLDHSARVALELGDEDEARKRSREAVRVVEHELGPRHPRLVSALDTAGLLHLQYGDVDEAVLLLVRAVSIGERNEGVEPVALAATLRHLGLAYHLRGELKKAAASYAKALALLEKKVGGQHPAIADTLLAMARLEVDGGDLAAAEKHVARALEIREAALGKQHPGVAEVLEQSATMHELRGDMAAAVSDRQRAGDIEETHLAVTLAPRSEAAKLAYMARLAVSTDAVISLQTLRAPDDAAALELAVTTVLRRKGRVVDVLGKDTTVLRARGDARDVEALRKLGERRAELANSLLAGPKGGSERRYRAWIAHLRSEVATLEAALGERSAALAGKDAVTLKDVQAAIAADSALVEIAWYQPSDPKHKLGAVAKGAPRYVAYVVTRARVGWVDLGEASVIDGAITAFRKALADPASKDVRERARAIDGLIMEPLRAQLGNVRTLVIAPDGAINLVPFAAFVDAKGHYLIESVVPVVVGSGRELVVGARGAATGHGALVIAAPEFGDVAKGRGGGRPALAGVTFGALPGTAEEAAGIAELMPGAVVVTGEAAEEGVLKAAHAPAVLHVATHGFFLGDTGGGAGARGLKLAHVDSVIAAETPSVVAGATLAGSPLSRSGLALAGANVGSPFGEDGVLTALEATTLDLSGTQLVVLSACETGVGEVKNGDGVHGLRRAFAIAGAQTVVMSLWLVDDAATRDLMIAYYRALRDGRGRAEAMAAVQRSVIASKPDTPPYYWAAFVVSGEAAPVDWSMLTPMAKRAAVRGSRGCICRVGVAEAGGQGGGAVVLLAMVGLMLVRRARRAR